MKYVGIFILGFITHHFTGPIGMIIAIGLSAWWMSNKRKVEDYGR